MENKKLCNKPFFSSRAIFYPMKNENHLRKNLERIKRMGLLSLSVDYIMDHEKAHYNKATELGRNPIYGIVIYRVKVFGETKNATLAAAVTCDKDTSEEDLEKIAMAPDHPSDIDMVYLRK